MKKTLLSTSILAIGLSSALHSQAQSFDGFIKDSKLDMNFRFRTESVDTDTVKDTALANTLKSRLTFKSADIAGFSVLVEGDNVLHISDDFNDKENGHTEYNVVLDQETTQLNQAYAQFTGFSSTIKVGNQRILLDNQRHVGGVAFRQDEATFDAFSITNQSIDNTTIFAAVANNRNTITNDNTEENIALVNTQYAFNKDLTASAFYYAIEDTNNIEGLDFDTFGLRSKGKINNIKFEAELASQNKTTAAGGDFTSLYYHINAGTKLGAVNTTLGYEAFGSDDGESAFATPLGTNHKFFGWSDVFLTGGDNDGITDLYASAVSMVSGIKFVGQFHHFNTEEGSDALGNEVGLMLNKKFSRYSANLKVAQYIASDYAENNLNKADTTKIWFTASAKL